MSTEMSVTRALATLKATDAKIEKAIASIQFLALTAGTDAHQVVVGSSASVAEVNENIKARYTSLKDMLTLRDALKGAIIKSNAAQVVTIGKATMTVAQAIEAKRSLALKELLLRKMVQDFNANEAAHSRYTKAYNDKVEAATAAAYGKDKKVTEADIALVTGPLAIKNQVGIIDPLKASALIEELTAEIEDFKQNVDFVLSESNATTKITV